MNNVNEVIERMRLVTNSETFADLAHIMGVALATVNNWKRRGEVPEKNILKCIHLSNSSKEYLLFGKNKDNNSQNVIGNNINSVNGSGNVITGSNNNQAQTQTKNDFGQDIEEIASLLYDYGSPKFIRDLKEKLLAIKSMHE